MRAKLRGDPRQRLNGIAPLGWYIPEAPIFVEIFSGSGKLAQAVATAGWQVMCWDILKGPDYDLTLPKIQDRLKGWLNQGAIRAFHMGFPCSSWSRARDLPNGPPRLRSQHHIWGLPDLAPHDLG